MKPPRNLCQSSWEGVHLSVCPFKSASLQAWQYWAEVSPNGAVSWCCRSNFRATCDVWEWERSVAVSLWWTEAICWLTLFWTVVWYNSDCLSGEFGALENKVWLNHGGKSTNSFFYLWRSNNTTKKKKCPDFKSIKFKSTHYAEWSILKQYKS